MHAIILTPVFPPYKAGMAHVALQHASFLEQTGITVTVVTPRYRTTPKDEKFDGTVVRLKSWMTFGNAAYIRSFASIGHEFEKADVIILEYPFIDCIGALEAIMNQYPEKKLAVYYHMDLIAHNWKKLPFTCYTKKALRFFKKLQKQGRLCFAGSSRDYVATSDAAEFLSITTEIPLAVMSKHFEVKKSDYAQKEWGIGENTKVVLFVGALDRAHEFKGVRNIIAAMKENQNSIVLLVGDGDKRASYEQEAEGQNNIKFLGKVSDEVLSALYQSADVVVLPSDSSSEAFGMVLAEAQMCGTSVIASDLPGVRGVVNPATGIRIPAQNVQALAHALQKIPKKTEAIMKSNREFAERWSVEKIAEQFVTWIQQDGLK